MTAPASTPRHARKAIARRPRPTRLFVEAGAGTGKTLRARRPRRRARATAAHRSRRSRRSRSPRPRRPSCATASGQASRPRGQHRRTGRRGRRTTRCRAALDRARRHHDLHAARLRAARARRVPGRGRAPAGVRGARRDPGRVDFEERWSELPRPLLRRHRRSSDALLAWSARSASGWTASRHWRGSLHDDWDRRRPDADPRTARCPAIDVARSRRRARRRRSRFAPELPRRRRPTCSTHLDAASPRSATRSRRRPTTRPTCSSCSRVRPILTHGKQGRKGSWRGKRDVVRDALAAADAAVDARVDRSRAATSPCSPRSSITSSCSSAPSSTSAAATARLEFHDLLVLARELLRHDPESARRAARAVAHDPAARRVPGHRPAADRARRAARDGDDRRAGRSRGGRSRSVPGRSFVVGDPKQSIYRFRRADIERVRHGAHEPRARRRGARRELPLGPGDHRVRERRLRRTAR